MYDTLTHLGHAGFLLQYQDVKLLIDPWFNAAFHGAWYPRPYNRHLKDWVLDQNPSHLYVSHAHEDHFDAKFLAELDRDIQIIAPDFADKQMQWKFRHFHNKIFLDHKHQVLLGSKSMTLEMYIDNSKNDSALLIDVDGYKILDLNDCHLEEDAIPKADELWCQFSGATHYPHCYDFPAVIQAQKVAEFKERAFRDLSMRVRKTQCKVYIPSAGPPCFLDTTQEHLNAPNTIFYPWSEFDQKFRDTFPDVTVKTIFKETNVTTQCYRVETELERELFYDDDIKITHSMLDTYFGKIKYKHRHLFKENPKTFDIVLGTRRYVVHLSTFIRCVYEVENVPSEMVSNYTFFIPRKLMKDILKGGEWDRAFLSCRIQIHREQDVFDTVLFQLLLNDMNPSKTQYLADTMTGNVKTVEREGWKYQRFCPHAGADLSKACITNGVIECPRHNWKWNLATGECLKGGDIKIYSKPTV